MANNSHGRNRVLRTVPTPTPLTTPVTPEPPVHRWPHPLDSGAPQTFSACPPGPAWRTDPTLHYIRCALSYQNQLLADIKALLLQLTPDDEDSTQP